MDSFLKQWRITESTTPLVEVGDELTISRSGDHPGPSFTCASRFADIASTWADVDDCRWFDLTGSLGYLKGTIHDHVGDIFAFAVRHSSGRQDLIRIEVTGPIASEQVLMAKLADNGRIGSRWATGTAETDGHPNPDSD